MFSSEPTLTETSSERSTPGASLIVGQDELKRTSERKLHALDSILCLTVFTPSVLFYWRGLWDLYGVYFFPDDEYSSNWAVFGLGCVGYLGFFLHPCLSALTNALHRTDDVNPVQNLTLSKAFEVNNICRNENTVSSSASQSHHRLRLKVALRRNCLGKVVCFLATRSYMYLYATAAMAYWRGGWLLLDYYLSEVDALLGCLVGFIVCYSALLGLRCTRSLGFALFAVYIDTCPNVLIPSTRFQTELSFETVSSLAKYVADSMFTYFVINTLAVATWRNAFGVYNVILAFDNPVIADVVSIAVGIGLCTLLLTTETSLAMFAARWHGWRRLVFDDVITFMEFVSESFLWRGAWNLNAQFIIPDPFLGGWVNHAIGTFLLMTLQVFSYVGTVGCIVDFPDENGHWRGKDKKTLFSTKYLRYFCRSDRDCHNQNCQVKVEETMLSPLP